MKKVLSYLTPEGLNLYPEEVIDIGNNCDEDKLRLIRLKTNRARRLPLKTILDVEDIKLRHRVESKVCFIEEYDSFV